MVEPQRERVTIEAVPHQPGRPHSPAAADLYYGDNYAQALLRSLMRAQIGATISVLAPAAALIALFPLIAVLLPSIATADVGPVPLSLIVLGGGIYPPLVALGFWYVRKARRIEQRFGDLLRDQ